MTDEAPIKVSIQADCLSLVAVTEILHSNHVTMKSILTEFHNKNIDRTAATARLNDILEIQAGIMNSWCKAKERLWSAELF